jgi:hypothetical protein
MNEGHRLSGRFLVCSLSLLIANASSSLSARASAIYAISVGQTVPDPPNFPDPGASNPFGFSLTAGSYSANTSSQYSSGGSWKPVPFGLQAVLNGPGQSYPVAPLPGDLNTWAMSVNSQGHLVGNSTTMSANNWINIWQNAPQTDHAIFYSVQGGTVALRTLNGTAGLPMSVNSADQVVGESYTPQGAIHGFITTPGGPATDLNSLIQQGSGYTIMAGVKINDQGQITALARDSSGVTKFLYLNPDPSGGSISSACRSRPGPPTTVPEPTALAFLCVVGACLAARRVLSSRASGHDAQLRNSSSPATASS